MSTSAQIQMPSLESYSQDSLDALLSVATPLERKKFKTLVEQRAQKETWDKCSLKQASWDAGPLLWLTQHTKTADTHAMAKGTSYLSPFPKKEYIRVMFDYFLWEQSSDPMASPTLFVLKTREMLFSWMACAYIAWMCQWHNTFWLCQSGKQEKGIELVEYARTLYRNQDDWMKARNPIEVDNSMEIRWANGGRFMAIPSGVDQARMYHSHGYFQDESAFLPEAEASFNAVRPVVRQVICGSTDEIGWYSQECKGQ